MIRGVITSKEYKSYVEEMNRSTTSSIKQKSSGNYYNTRIACLGKEYLDLVFNKYLNNGISIQQAADYLRIKAKSLEKLESLHLGYK